MKGLTDHLGQLEGNLGQLITEATLASAGAERYWTTKQVAERVQVTEDAVKKWLASGKLKKTKIGGATRITETDFQDYIRRCTERAASCAIK